MPTITPVTTPVPDSVWNRISNRITEVYPAFGWAGESLTAMVLTPQDLTILRPNVTFQLATPKVTRFDVMLEVQSRSRPGDPDTTLPLDRSHLIQYLEPPKRAEDTDEWEEYGEPVWDPIRFEVHLLMRRYFEQADADSDRT